MKRRPLGFGLAIAIAAVAILLWMLVRRDPWQSFVAAVGRSGHRQARGRFAVLDAHRPLLITRGAVVQPSNGVEVEVAAGRVLDSDADEHRRAIATFYLGHVREARQALQALALRRPSAAVWNDLAVVLAEQDRDDDTLMAALAAVEHALDLEPDNAAARFNRADLVERLGLSSCAIREWSAYLRVEPASPWSNEAQERVAALRSAQASTWADEYPGLVAAAGDGVVNERPILAHLQDARTAVLNQILPEWGRAVLDGREADASTRLALARSIGDVLRKANGDPMTAEVVQTIRAAADDARRRALADAHIRYGDAAEDVAQRRIAPAAPKFAAIEPLFDRLGSPAALMCAYYSATTAVDRGDPAAELRMLAGLAARTPATYRALLALLDRLRGTIFFFDGLYAESLGSYQRARDQFLAIGESENAIDTASRLTGALAALGRAGEAWPIDRAALKAAGRAGSPKVMQVALHSAAFVALEERRWDMAYALLDVELGIDGGSQRTRAESIAWRVLAAQRAAFRRGASSRMEEARKGADAVTDPDWRESTLNDLRLLEAMFIKDSAPEQAIDRLTAYIASARSRGRVARVPEILCERATVLRRLQRTSEAEADLLEAIRLVDDRGNRVTVDPLRDTFFGKSAAPFTMLADLRDSRGDVSGAISAEDLHRARILRDRGGRSQSLDETVASLDPGTALMTYGIFDDRLVLFVVRHDGVHRLAVNTSPAALERLVAQFVESIRGGRGADARRDGRSLYDLLIAPASQALSGAGKLVFVPDAPLDRVPFAALVQPDGTFLVQRFMLSISPAVRLYRPVPPRAARHDVVLSVGNPRLDEVRYPSLAPLADAEVEARKIASMYGRGVLLTGGEATEERVTALLPEADIIHFGTHAIADASNPDRSRLLLAPTARSDGTLTAAEVAALNLSHVDTVMLAGCTTAVSAGRSYGFVQSVAAGFLAAGAHHVVGSLWDIEDQAGRALSIELHRRLAGGAPVDRAVHETQLKMIATHPVSDWAALQLYASN